MATAWGKPSTWRWHRWLLVLVVLLTVLYLALSYWYLPGKLKQLVEEQGEAFTGRDIQVEAFKYNPFTLTLDSYGLVVPDQPEQPLLAWQHVGVDFSFWSSLIRRELVFERLTLNGVESTIQRTQQGFNFDSIVTQVKQRLAANKAEQPPAEPKPKKSPPGLMIHNINITNSGFHYVDVTGTEPATTGFDNIAIDLTNLYLATGDEELYPFNLEASLENAGRLKLAGEYRLDPLHLQGELSTTAIQLSPFSQFLANELPLAINSGTLQLGLQFEVDQADQFELKIGQGNVQLSGLALDDEQVDPGLLRLESLQVQGASFDLRQRKVRLAETSIKGFQTHQWLGESGDIRLLSVLPKSKAGSTQANGSQAQPAQAKATKTQPAQTQPTHTQPNQTQSNPWSVVVDSIQLADNGFTFQDRSHPDHPEQRLSQLNGEIKALNLTTDKDTDVQLTALINEQGKLALNSQLSLLPLVADAQVELQQLPLNSLSPYLQKGTYLSIVNGLFGLKGSLALDSSDTFAASGNLQSAIENLSLIDTRSNEAAIDFERLAVTDVNFDTAKKDVVIADVRLVKPKMDLIIGADKSLNLASLVKSPATPASTNIASDETVEPAPVEEKEESQSGQSKDGQPWNYTVKAAAIEKGKVQFTDLSIEPSFATELANLNVTVGTLGSRQTTHTPFKLTSDLDGYAPLELNGELAPLNQGLAFSFTSTLTGLEMARLTPYTGTFIGHKVKTGQLGLNLKYDLKNNKLSGRNEIIADGFFLGDKVASEQAINAPISLGLALLRNNKDVIDLDVKVAGDVNDPSFSVSGLILKTILNVIVKAATSPFKMLGALVPGSEDMGKLKFEAGSAQLNAANVKKLKQLVAALSQRPQLALELTGNASEQEDGEPLRASLLQQQVAKQRNVSVAELTGEQKDWWQVKENRKVLAQLNDEAGLLVMEKRRSLLNNSTTTLSKERLETLLFNQVFKDLQANQELTSASLLALADERALAIKQHLVEKLEFAEQRVALNKASDKKLKGRTIELGVTAL